MEGAKDLLIIVLVILGIIALLAYLLRGRRPL